MPTDKVYIEIVHTDVNRPHRTTECNGEKYAIVYLF